jgi:hypothetical protein
MADGWRFGRRPRALVGFEGDHLNGTPNTSDLFLQHAVRQP